jgi:CubicO group peptidase (beta-lactamase class C family)
MRRSVFTILLPVLLLPVDSIRAQETVDYEALDAYIMSAVEASQATGLAVGIIKDGDVAFARGYGVRSIETMVPVDAQTQFGIGSASKAFTVAALGLLVDEGRLNWHDKVIDHLPWLRLQDAYVTRELTIGDVLSHRSGLGTLAGNLLWFGTDYTSEEVVRRIRSLPVRNGFRSEFRYQTAMFVAAGLVVEAVSGMPWHEFVEQRILRVLGMEHSSTNLADLRASANVAIPHIDGRPLPFINYDNVGPAGGMNSSVADILSWLKMWLNEGSVDGAQFLSARTIRTITSSQMFLNGGPGAEPQGVHFINYGYGWWLTDYAGRKVVRHSGSMPGYLSEVVFVPEENLGIAVLLNVSTPICAAIANKILDMFTTSKDRDYVAETLQDLGRDKPVLERERQQRLSARVPNTTPSLSLAAYAGLYRDTMYGDAEVADENGKLRLTLLPARELFSAPLEHFHFDTFKVQFPGPELEFGLVTFHLDVDGQVETLTIDLPSPYFHFSNLRFVKQRSPIAPTH